MKDLNPVAKYNAPDVKDHIIDVGEGPHSTNGKTTQISDIVINAGGEDKDKPTEANATSLGQLRAKVTTLQDNVNVFLTQRMKQEKNDDIEKRVLDDGVDEDSD